MSLLYESTSFYRLKEICFIMAWNMNYNNKLIDRIISLLVCLSIPLVMFFSLFYISTNIKHDCDHDNCPICEEIELLQNVVKQVTAGLGTCLILSCILIPVIYKISAILQVYNNLTPISMKVRMNN